MAWRLRCWRRSSQPPSTFNLTNSAGQRLEARLPHGHWRAVARYEAGETTRSIAAAQRISPSCVSKWMKLKREPAPSRSPAVGHGLGEVLERAVHRAADGEIRRRACAPPRR